MSIQKVPFISVGEQSLVVALALLVFFHMYWFALIIKILMEALVGGEVQGDVRDDDEIDSQCKKAMGIGMKKRNAKKEN